MGSHCVVRSRLGKKRQMLAWRKILSDVDDTLSSSGGSWPAGMDTSYPKKTVYPGVLGFYRELDIGTSGQFHVRYFCKLLPPPPRKRGLGRFEGGESSVSLGEAACVQRP